MFDVNEITVLYIDFHFHNKKYDEIDWDTQFDFVAYKLYDGGREEVTSWVVSKTISSNENNVMVSDYWGEEGTNDFGMKENMNGKYGTKIHLLLNAIFTFRTLDLWVELNHT